MVYTAADLQNESVARKVVELIPTPCIESMMMYPGRSLSALTAASGRASI